MNPLSEEIKKRIVQEIENQGFIVFDIKWITSADKSILRIYTDKEWGGITLQECSFLSRIVSTVLDEMSFTDFPYILEVSSPGIDWPLKRLEDFKRVKGRRVKIILKNTPSDSIEGDLIDVDEQGNVYLQDAKNNLINVNLTDVLKAKQVIPEI